MRVTTNCTDCEATFDVPKEAVEWRVCTETDFHTMRYLCSYCGAENSSHLSPEMAVLLTVDWVSWSMRDGHPLPA